jgi:hypothetical protein
MTLIVKWPKVLYFNSLNDKPICRWIDLCNGTLFRIIAFFTYPFYNHPKDGLYVGIERCGSFLFGISNKFSADYVFEKLNIPESDAAAIADWMNAQLEFNVRQQGHYEKQYILNSEPYGLIGEKFSMPLIPEVINE